MTFEEDNRKGIFYPKESSSHYVLSNMVEVDFVDGPEHGFRKVKESLERMGVANNSKKTLYQTAHIFHKAGRYYICHFKEMFALDGGEVDLSYDDLCRRNLIVKYLKEWNLIVPKTNAWENPMGKVYMLKVLKYSERSSWTLMPKYKIGPKKIKR